MVCNTDVVEPIKLLDVDVYRSYDTGRFRLQGTDSYQSSVAVAIVTLLSSEGIIAWERETFVLDPA